MSTGLQKEASIALAAVTGATGFIGRWLIAELTAQGTSVVACLRRPADQLPALQAWVNAHGGQGARVEAVRFDLLADGLGLSDSGRARLLEAQVVYNLAALFGFNLPADRARRANVDAALALVELLGQAPTLRRLIHISGYRTRGAQALALDVDDAAALTAFYASHGAYEASKMEAHERVRRAAQAQGVPLTRVSPALVIGDSRTGETTQMTGLAEVIEQLWRRALPVLAGGPNTWMPVVAVDFLAQLLARLPADPETIGSNLVVFDDRTPTLPALMQRVAARMDVRAPTRTVSAGLLRALPQRLTGVEPESLSFISDDRYDPAPLQAACARLGLTLPDPGVTLDRWVDYLIGTRFGALPARSTQQAWVAGARTFMHGDRQAPATVWLHGLLLNEGSWGPVIEAVGGPALAPDLPGLGRSAAGGGTPGEWTSALLSEAHAPVIVGHSLGTAFAVEHAAQHPERVAALVLVSPFFLQARPGWAMRRSWLTRWVFRWLPKARRRGLLGRVDTTAADDALDLLSRPQVARHSARWLAWASRRATRARLRAQLSALEMPVTLIVGDADPLAHAAPDGVEVITVPGAGHHPQLSHPQIVAQAVSALTAERA